MVGPNQYQVAPANDSYGYMSWSQTFGWRVNVVARSISMPLSSGFINPIPQEGILFSLRRI